MGTQAIQEVTVQALHLPDDGADLVGAGGELGPVRLVFGLRHPRHRGGIGLEREQAGAELVVEFQRGAPPLVVLRREKLPVEAAIGGAGFGERLRDAVEALGDDGEFA